MMKNITHRILTVTAICLAGMLQSQCTIVDTGGAVNNVGRYIPVDADNTKQRKHPKTCYTVHTCQDTSYIEIEVRYLPARNKWFHCWMIGGGYVEAYRRFEMLDSDFKHPLDGTYFARIPADKLHAPDMHRYVTELIPASRHEPFPAGTVTGTVNLPPHGARAILRHLEDDCSRANAAVQPLRWVAELADVPLSVIATPVNWCFMLFGEELWKF